MHVLQTIGRILSGAILRTGLIILPLGIACTWMLSHTDYIKQTIASSGIYTSVVPAVLEESARATTDPEGKLLLQDPGVRSAVESAFSPDSIQKSTETILDAYHAWITGKTPELRFTIDTKTNIDTLRQNIAQYAQARAQSLPICTLAQLKELPPEQTILTAPCIPAGSNTAAIGQDFSNKVLAQADFLQKTTITEQDLPKEPTAKSGSATTQSAQYTQLLTNGQWVVGILTLIAGGFYVLLSDDRRRAGKNIAKTALGIGIFLLIGCALYAAISSQLEKSLIASNSPAFQSAIIALFKKLGSDFNKIVAIVSGLYVAAGVATLIVIKRLAPPIDQPSYQVTEHNMQPPQGGTV